VFDGVQLDFNVFLSGEVRSPGGETLARAFLRDPAHINDADPFAGAPTITFDTSATPTGPVDVPEPSTLTVLGVAGAACWGLARRRSENRRSRSNRIVAADSVGSTDCVR
jgi:hypothetical protein